MSRVFTPLFPTGSAKDPAVIGGALDERVVISFNTAAAVTTWLASNTIAIWLKGVGGFSVDTADTTSAHDGTTVLVSSDGKRFKRDIDYRLQKITDKDLTTPPTQLYAGAVYLLYGAPSGAWSGYQGYLAVDSQRGWLFVAPFIGQIVYVADEDSYYSYSQAGVWRKGLGTASTTTASVTALAIREFGGLAVENQTTTSPPAATSGIIYIVGAGATGAWAGQDGNIAIGNGSTWDFLTKYTGCIIWDKSQLLQYVYRSGSWQRVVANAPRFVGSTSANSASYTAPGSGAGAQVGTLVAAVTKATNKLIFQARVRALGIEVDFAIFRESEATPLEFVTAYADAAGAQEQTLSLLVETAPGDTASRTYKFRVSGHTSWSQFYVNAFEVE